jgi:tetratricopeptide (TPR) repeat protein
MGLPVGDQPDLIEQLLAGRVKAALFGGDRAPRLGRLIVLEPIGSGAMGAVFAAYDPTLDRKVAVKVLSSSGERANRDLLREARALGKLAHPNVVAIHDAGEVAGSVYVVMELVCGPDIGSWARGEPGWPEIAAAIADAAEGVHAAHVAGLVHADVKPANIVVGSDRVRVVDFGLARVAPEAGGRSGGTPAYMAPEILDGGASSPEADQFALAVTAHECLYGERPPREAGGVGRPKSDVPRWLHEAVRRGLAESPDERHLSMRAFAAALRPGHRRRRAAAAIALVAAALIGAGLFALRSEPAAVDPCGGGEALIAEIWSPRIEAAVAARLGAGRWAARAVERLGDHAAGWAGAHRRICEATRARGIQSDSLLDLRMRCLERHRDRLDALVDAVATAEEGRERYAAATAIAGLDEPARCEVITEAGELELPADPAARRRALADRARLDRGVAAFALGRYDRAGAIAAELAARDPATPGLAARVALLGAAVEGRTGDAGRARRLLERAVIAAAEARAFDAELEAWLRLLRQELFAGSRDKVFEWAPFARAAAARARRSTGEIDGVVGEALRGLDRLSEARVALERALGDSGLAGERRALVEMNLGTVELLGGDPVKAEAAFARARDLAAGALGADHPGLALYLDKIAVARRERGRVREALADHDRALALRETAYGSDDRAVATTLLRRAETLLAAGQVDRAIADLDRAARIRVAVFGAGHRRLADVERARGDAAFIAGDRDRAIERYRRAAGLDPAIDVTARLARAGAPVPLDALQPVDGEGRSTRRRVAGASARILALAAGGDRDRARAEAARLVRALAGRQIAASMAVDLGDALLAIGDRDRAAAAYERALESLANEPSEVRRRAEAGRAEAR